MPDDAKIREIDAMRLIRKVFKLSNQNKYGKNKHLS